MDFSPSSSSGDEDVILNSSAKKWYLYKEYQKTKVHPLNKKRRLYGEFHHLYKDLRKDPVRFFDYMRLKIETFDYILKQCGDKLNKNYQNCHRQPIGSEERLMVTLRFLSTGISFRSLAFSFRMGKSTIRNIVMEVTEILWDVFVKTHMPVPSQDDFRKIADDFYKIWNFPNCVGALDGKHIRVRCPSNSGSMFFNYKGYFSIVLQALVDANYRFINIDVGGYGKQSDGGTFKASPLYKKLSQGTLNLPASSLLPGSNLVMPYVMIGDEAYPLMKNLLKPYSKNNLNAETENFNKRLSRARRTVECAFGILRAKWQILDKPILTDVTLTDKIVKAICILHNIIIDMEGMDHNLRDVTFQNHNQNNEQRNAAGRLNDEAKFVRENFKIYFMQQN